MKLGGLFLAALAATFAFGGEGQRTIEAKRLTKLPVIDGALADGEWSEASLAEKFYNPFSTELEADQTRAWVGYTDEGIYAAFYCLAANPEDLVGREVRPGVAFEGDDFIALRIDPFGAGQNEQISRFQVNLLGTQNWEIAGGRASKAEWRGQWKSATKRVADGYTVELMVPWAALNYPEGKDRTMLINFVRWHAKLGRKSIWSDATPNERPELNGRLVGVTPPKKAAPKPQFLAYALGEYDNDRERATFDAGLDVRYPVTSRLTAVGSLNPDFKNVEQQIERLAFARQERFFGDSRPFFAEGSSNFGLTSEYGIGRLFYSRRINDFDFAAKTYGRLSDNLSVGALGTFGKGRNVGVLNVNQSYGTHSAFSAFATVDDRSARQNQTVGGNGFMQSGNWGVSAETVQERDSNYRAQATSGELYYTVPRLFSTLRFTSISPDFNPSLGLIGFNDKRGFYSYTEYGDQPTKGQFTRVHADVFVDRFDHFDGSTLSHGAEVSAQALHKSDQNFRMGVEDRVFEGLRDRVVFANYINGFTNRFRRWSLTGQIGERSEMPFRYVSAEVTQRVAKRLDLGLGFNSLDFDGKSDQMVLTAGWEFDAKRSLGARVVRQDNDVNAYVAYRSSGFTGNDLFIILGDPNARKFQPRLTVKMVFPFTG